MENKTSSMASAETYTTGSPEVISLHDYVDIDRVIELQSKYESNYQRLKRQEEIISITSHELKTPITTIKLFLNLLEELTQKEENHQVFDLVLKAETQVNRLIKLVNNLQDTNVLQGNGNTINQHIFDFSALLNNTAETFRYQSQQHEIVIQGNAPTAILADATRIEQVLVNLLSNAVKYSPENGKIIVSVETFVNELRVSVQDFGIGIPTASLPHVFESYFRAHQNDKRFKGTGLGLYISQQIISQHRGEIGVNSTEGKGSTFWFTLPLQAPVQL